MHKLKYILLFVGIIIFLDFLSGKILSEEIDKITFSDFGKINKGINSKSDVIVLGSSRALHHYDTEFLSDILNLSCYNMGMGGNGIFLNYAMLKENLEFNTPKIVILDLAPNIITDEDSYSKLNKLLPYYRKYSSFKEIINLNPDFSNLEMISSFYIYNSTIYDIIRSRFTPVEENKYGFSSLEGEIDPNFFDPFFLENEKMDKNQILYLNKIIDLCKENNIELINIVSPTYVKFDSKNRIISKLDSISKSKNITFYDYSDYAKFYLRPQYFKDQIHLNEEGAAIFSKKVAEVIKKETKY